MGQTLKTSKKQELLNLGGKVEDVSSTQEKIFRYLTDPIKFNDQAIKAFGLNNELKPEPWMHLVAMPFMRTVGSKKTYEIQLAVYIWDTRALLCTYSLQATKKKFESLLTELTRENRKNSIFKFPRDNNKALDTSEYHGDLTIPRAFNEFTFKLTSVRY